MRAPSTCPGLRNLDVVGFSARQQSPWAPFQALANWEMRSRSFILKMTKCRNPRHLSKHVSRRRQHRRLASASLRVTCIHSITSSTTGRGRDFGISCACISTGTHTLRDTNAKRRTAEHCITASRISAGRLGTGLVGPVPNPHRWWSEAVRVSTRKGLGKNRSQVSQVKRRSQTHTGLWRYVAHSFSSYLKR